jgi:hypothetical protein
MITVPIKRVLTKEQADELVGTVVPITEANLKEPCIVYDEDTQEPIVAYFKMEPEVTKLLRSSVMNIKMGVTLRMKTGMRNASRTFGMAPRSVVLKRESCRATALASESPDEHTKLIQAARYLQDQLKIIFPEIWKKDKEEMTKIGADWLLEDDAIWTSGVVNKTATLPYHRDGFNFDTWSAMPVVRRGVEGGLLNFPEYDLTVECRDGWVVYFCGYRWVHGVTPMKVLVKDGYRYSIVYYALRGMKDCFTFAIETAKGKSKRMEREENMKEFLLGNQDIKCKN